MICWWHVSHCKYLMWEPNEDTNLQWNSKQSVLVFDVSSMRFSWNYWDSSIYLRCGSRIVVWPPWDSDQTKKRKEFFFKKLDKKEIKNGISVDLLTRRRQLSCRDYSISTFAWNKKNSERMIDDIHLCSNHANMQATFPDTRPTPCSASNELSSEHNTDRQTIVERFPRNINKSTKLLKDNKNKRSAQLPRSTTKQCSIAINITKVVLKSRAIPYQSSK